LRRRCGGAALVAAALLLVGWYPDPPHIANAVANANREAGRATTLELRVELRFEGDPEPAASGTLVSDPSGRARLELVSPRGFVERHLNVDGRVRAARNGQPLEDARTFLPPFWVLQTASAAGLQRWLAELGADAGRVDLGYDGEADCFVLGGRDPGRSEASSRRGAHGAYWVEEETLAPVRLELPDGTRFEFARQTAAFEASPGHPGVRVPAWIEVRAPGEPPARLLVQHAAAVDVPAGGFDLSWLARVPVPAPAAAALGRGGGSAHPPGP
jgi:hypothetical protein